MRRLILTALVTVCALAVWAAVFLAGTLEGWWRRPLAPPGDAAAFMAAATRLADALFDGFPGKSGETLARR